MLKPLTLPASFLACLLLTAGADAAQLQAYTSPEPVTLTLTDTRDQAHSLAQYRGRVVLLNFWASWCPPCIYEMPELKALQKRFSGQPFDVVTVNVGEKKYQVRKFAAMLGLNLPVLLDSDSRLFKAWEVKTLPTSFLLDAGGRIRYRVTGNPGWSEPQTLAIIEKAIEEAAHASTLSEPPDKGKTP